MDSQVSKRGIQNQIDFGQRSTYLGTQRKLVVLCHQKLGIALENKALQKFSYKNMSVTKNEIDL